MRKLKYKNKNILFRITFRLRNIDEFSKIESNFKIKGYTIEEYGEIDKKDFTVSMIEEKIKKLREKYGEKCNIVVISNIKDLFFAIFKLYNKIIDRYIFFIDRVNYNILNDKELIYRELLEKIDIKKENINKKIYINMRVDNFNSYRELLLFKENILYFKDIERFDYNLKEEMELDEIDIKKYLNFNREYIAIYILGLIRNYDIQKVREVTIPIFKFFRTQNIIERQRIARSIYEAPKIESLDFKEKIAIYSLIVLLELPFDYILKFFIKMMREDTLGNEKYYPAIISDIIYYGLNNNAAYYREYMEDLKYVFEKLYNYYLREKNIIRKNKFENNKKIAFIVDRLYNVNYSVEKVTFDTVRNLKKYYPDYDITIFVEDNFDYLPDEKIMIHSYLGENQGSEVRFEEHFRELEETDVKISYSLPIGNKEKRVKDMVEAIIEYNPEVVISTTLYSYSLNLIHDIFPTIYMSLISFNFVNKYDVELYNMQHIKKVLNIINEDLKENIYDFNLGIDFKKGENRYKRSDFGIEDGDFLMVTVGVRLKTELKEDYIDMIVDFLKKYPNSKWYLIGESNFSYIEKKYSEFKGKQIFMKEFENNLSDFYQICNISLNPPREGGGFSLAQSIVNNIPVVCDIKSSSGMYMIGESNCVSGMKEYFEEMEKLIVDNEYYQKKIDAEKLHIKKYNYEEVIKKLVTYIEIAKERFRKRTDL